MDFEQRLKVGFAGGFYSTCRSCLVTGPEVKSVFKMGSGTADHLWQCTEVQVVENDGMPSGICPSCYRELESAYKFRTQCRQSNLLLLGFINQFELKGMGVKQEVDETPLKEDENAEDEDEFLEMPVEVISAKSEPESDEVVKSRSSNKKDGLKTSKNDSPESSDPLCTFTCQVCGREFKQKLSFQKHLSAHSEPKVFTCDFCPKTFANKHRLKIHQYVHQNQKFVCPICGEEFKYKPRLNAHLALHEDPEVYACKMCPKKYKSQRTLDGHVFIAHSGESRSHTCDVCGSSFATSKYLEAHRRGKHEGAEFICDVCGKSFSTKMGLRAHLFRHFEPNKYACDACNVAFMSHRSLQRHDAKFHGGSFVEPKTRHTCDICGKVLVGSRSSLRSHLITHTGEKSFSCDVCGSRFTRSGQMYRHKRRKHGWTG